MDFQTSGLTKVLDMWARATSMELRLRVNLQLPKSYQLVAWVKPNTAWELDRFN